MYAPEITMEEAKDRRTGISNRETAREEERERHEHPSVPPEAEDSDARASEERQDEVSQRQTSNKAGSRSNAQKTSESKYTDRPAPPSRKVPGAYGHEHDDRESEREDVTQHRRE